MNMTAIEDAERLAAWCAPNEQALQDQAIEEAVLRALSGPIPSKFLHQVDSTTGEVTPIDVPLLRFANGRDAMNLLDAVLDPPIPKRGHFICDVLGSQASEPNTLWIPCGRSIVQVTMRCHARGLIQDDTRAHLVWWE